VTTRAPTDGLRVLERAECLELLARGTIGRVGLAVNALPTVLPVTYRLVDDRVVFRTGPGKKLAAATSSAVVAFEVDHFDLLSHTGWSVVVTGVAQEVVDPAEIDALERVGVPWWTPADQTRLVAVPTDMVSGRELLLPHRL
jgi:nitroimidazol reductase NimA-like FMN-containing flavoprotein (pyridoxamine 5'-phosphate oxidase superfamily)